MFTACPECGAELQAALKIYLYGVEVNSAGLLIKYDGGPQPENEDDILELCDLQNTTVYCANDHVFNSDTTVRTKARSRLTRSRFYVASPPGMYAPASACPPHSTETLPVI